MRSAIEVARFVWNHPANRGARARALGRALAFQARARLLKRPVIVPVGERSRISIEAGHGNAGLVYANPTEWPEMNVWRRTWTLGGLFLDIGANVGAYAIWAAEAGCEVVAVEPDAWAVGQLAANLRLNGYDAQVVRAAVTDQPGSVLMTSDLGVTNRIVEAGHAGPVDQVRATTVDELLGDRRALGVKVDVEGAELLVLRGATRALAERRIALMQLEWTGACSAFGHTREEAAELLDRAGYELLTPDHLGELHPVAHTGPQQPDVFARPR